MIEFAPSYYLRHMAPSNNIVNPTISLHLDQGPTLMRLLDFEHADVSQASIVHICLRAVNHVTELG